MNRLVKIIAIIFLSQGCFLFGNAREKNNKVFKAKEIKSVMLQAANWQLDHPKHDKKDWTNGALYAGIFATWEATKSDVILSALLKMGNDNNWKPNSKHYHADNAAICQTYIDLYRVEKQSKMVQPTIESMKSFIENPYPAKQSYEVTKWWWCDALFMAPPTLVKLGITTGEAYYLKANDKYFKECYDLLYNKQEHLFARDLNYVIKEDGSGRREANGERIFWSRGNGWVMGGLVRILNELPADYPERSFYVKLFKDMASRILSLQQDDGLWRASLLDPDSYPGGEVSGSGFFCYALAWGINNKLLDKTKYLPAVKKAWIALNECTNKDGRVGWVQPIGGDPRRNFSEESWEVYGTGAFLLAGSEVIKLPKK